MSSPSLTSQSSDGSLSPASGGRPRLGRTRRLGIAVATFLATVAAAAALLAQADRRELPQLGVVPAFELTAADNSPFALEQLANRVWIANFIFTRCPTVCPLFSHKMAQLQNDTADLGERLMLVSFSVDPTWDTPARLAEYARKFDADPQRWKFLTGLPEDVRLTVRDGLKTAMEHEGMVGEVPNIIHGTHFVLVDGAGTIRGYYNSDSADRIRQLIEDARLLIDRTNSR